MPEVSQFARYNRVKIGVISLAFWVALLTCAWLILVTAQGNYGGRRDPVVVLVMLIPAVICGGALVWAASSHLLKCIINKNALFAEGGEIKIRGLTDFSVPIDQILSIYVGKSDRGRIVIECVNGKRYYIRGALMEGRAQDIACSAWKFVVTYREGEYV